MREQTLLTREWVASKQSFLDWDTQPSSYKIYPHFCYRVTLADHPQLRWLSEIRKVSDKRIVAHKLYHRLNVPSAGNLHPIEIYVQIRNISGVLSGIYHLDTLNNALVMIREIGAEGIESELGMEERFSGVIVMLSLVPFRSYWKYALRAWRYLYLDLGHQIGALMMIARHFGLSLSTIAPLHGLNEVMGMGEDEVIAAVYGVGEWSERRAKPLEKPLMRVQPTDYSEKMEILRTSIQTIPPYSEISECIAYESALELNLKRRSAREFNPYTMSDETLQKLISIPSPPSLEIIVFVFQAHTMHSGVYRYGECTESGNFNSEIVHLLLDQRFISGSNMVVLIHAEHFSAQTHIEAGIYAQGLYMMCEEDNVGCSGIGAFYDNEALRWSEYPLLYAVAIGGKV